MDKFIVKKQRLDPPEAETTNDNEQVTKSKRACQRCPSICDRARDISMAALATH